MAAKPTDLEEDDFEVLEHAFFTWHWYNCPRRLLTDSACCRSEVGYRWAVAVSGQVLALEPPGADPPGLTVLGSCFDLWRTAMETAGKN